MNKLVTLLTLVAVVWTIGVYVSREPKLISGNVDTTENLSNQLAVVPETLGLSTEVSNSGLGKIYIDEKHGFSIRYPEGTKIIQNSDGSTTLSRGSLLIQITQYKLSNIDTVNTIAEKDINTKIDKLGNKFKLVDTISPIAIGSQTGITFTDEEAGAEITYYYIPQGFNYLVIENRTVENADGNQISISDNIIYSLELIEK